MASSIADFRAKLHQDALISVTIPDTDLVIECRHPALFTMAIRGLMSWPAFDRVQALHEQETASELILDNRPMPSLVDKAKAFGDFLDDWVCAAAVSPQVRRSAADLDVQRGEALAIDEIPLNGRIAIWTATMRRTDVAVAEFRGDEPPRDPDRSGGEAVRDEALDTVVSAG